MATFKPIVKSRRKDGFYQVYIRVTHQTKLAYIVTDKLVNASGLSRSGEIEDPYVLQYCTWYGEVGRKKFLKTATIYFEKLTAVTTVSPS